MNRTSILGIALIVSGASCEAGPPSIDAGEPDAGGIDAALVVDGGRDAGEAPATFCAEACEATADCEIEGSPLGYLCEGGRCVLAARCTTDAQCTAELSGWAQPDTDGDFVPDAPCTADGPAVPSGCAASDICCEAGWVCLEGGLCAAPADGVVSCSEMALDEVMATAIGGELASVCGVAGAACDDGACRVRCASDDDCTDERYPSCDATIGECGCAASPDSCAGNTAGGTVCGSDGACGCVVDGDCTGTGTDTCFAGVCGCSSASACGTTMAFDGTTIVCE